MVWVIVSQVCAEKFESNNVTNQDQNICKQWEKQFMVDTNRETQICISNYRIIINRSSYYFNDVNYIRW